MRADRLLWLAECLEKYVPEDRFDMETWGDIGFPENKCGTSACALGWAVQFFPFTGLHSESSEYEMHILFEGFTGIGDAEVFFEIDAKMARHIFLGGYENSTPKQVATCIREVVECHRKD